MEFLYTIDPNAEEPIMLIDKHIGWDDEDGEGIMGDKFCRELMFLDTLNKSKINVWIHSGGGKVMDGEKIVAAILKSKTKIDTHNIGLVASIAGPIFLAGRNRYMMDYAKFMMHPIGNSPDPKARKAFEDGVVTMLAARTDISEAVIRQMVNETTWLDADQCEKMGLCIKESSSEFNKPRKAFDPTNFSESYKDFTSVVNKLITEKTPIKMKNITNKLKLIDGANEETIVNAISEIENKLKISEGKLVSQEAENKLKFETLNKSVTDLTTERDGLKTKLTEIENKEKAEKTAKAKAEAKDLIDGAVKLGKIENKAEVIAKYVEKAEKDFDGIKELIELMPGNKTMPTNKFGEKKEGENTAIPYTAAGVMAKIAIENKQTRI